jgi:hypothetical protein
MNRKFKKSIKESGPAFGSARDEANAKKSIGAFLDGVEQKNDQAKLTYIQNRLTTITKNLVKLPTNPETGEFTAASARAAIDVLSPEFFEKFFGELKQAYPDQINFTPAAAQGPDTKPKPVAPTQTTQPMESKMRKLRKLIESAVRSELRRIKI